MKALLSVIFLTTGLLLSFTASAQQRWFEATGGVGISVPEAHGSPWSYGSRLLIHGGLATFFSINDRIAIKSGVMYQMKGMTTDASYTPDSVYSFATFSSENVYHVLSIPLQLAFTFPKSNGDAFRIAAGMNYGFMLAGKSKMSKKWFDHSGGKPVPQTFTYTHLVTIAPKDDIEGLDFHEGTPLNVFAPAVRIDISYQWQERLILNLFYEYNLDDVRMRTIEDSKVHLHAAGIGVGVRFW